MLLKFDSTVPQRRLRDICTITTGKLDANAMEDNGRYPFFTCAELPFSINTYAFDTEALLISGNGANVGYINYCKGKFNAYQRTYVLYDFKSNIHYIRCYLNAFLKQRIDQEKNTGNTPYIVLGTLANMKVFIPEDAEQSRICAILGTPNSKVSIETKILREYNLQKSYILTTMFI